jgi:tetratricopeptide (TPR) repeat protein
MLRSLIGGMGLMLAAPAAWADAAAECSQHQDAERRIRGCTQLVQQISQQNPRHPDLFKIYHNRGLAYWKKQQLDSAIPDYTKAIELNAREHSLYYDRGTLFLMKRQYDNAIKDYDKAVALNPRHANTYFNRGAAYVDKGQYDRGIQDFTKSIEIEPREAKGYYNRGNAYLKSKQAERAIPDYSKAIELDPKMAVAYGNRGLAYEAAGRKQEAIADLRKAIALDPGNKGSQEGLKRLQPPSPTATDPAAAEFCNNAKDQAKCLNTRALLAQIKKDKTAARWSKDVDFKYAKNDEEQTLLFELMLKSIPPAQQTKK